MSGQRVALSLGRALWLATALTSSAAWAGDDAEALLLKQGRHWQQVGDADRAADAWRKLLLIDAHHLEALYGMGEAEVSRAHLPQASSYLVQLRQIQGSDLYAGLLEQDIRLHQGNHQEQLAEARALVDAGDQAKALEAYRRLFGSEQPQGRIALEYYQLLGYSPGGAVEARQGLQRLAGQFPGDGQYALALAMLQIEKDGTRREGVRQLQRLSHDQQVGSQADEQWRNGLSWFGSPPPADTLASFRSYLAAHPDDAGIRRQLEAGERDAVNAKQHATSGMQAVARPDPVAQRLDEGMRAMQAGNDAEAETCFTEVLKARPNNANALGGMGILYLRRGDMANASRLLAQATRTAPGWGKALQSARYLEYVGQGNEARYAGDRTRARNLFEKAIALDGSQTLAFNALADLQADGGDLEAAAATYRKTLATHPQDADAWRGQVAVLAEAGKLEDAQRLLDDPPPDMQARPDDMARVRAAYAAGVARAAEHRGDDDAAAQAWAEAIRLEPSNPWHRLALAQNQMRRGNAGQAQATIDALLQSAPDNADALYIAALLDAQQQNWSQALSQLEKIPQQKRASHVRALQRRAWVNEEIGRATRLQAQNRNAEALAVLQGLELQVGDETDLLGTLAFAYADVGDAARGLALIEQRMQRETPPSPGLRLQYAGLLLKSGDEAGFARTMDGLAQAQLEGAEQANYLELRRLQHVREAEALRQKGDLAAAEQRLLPALAQRPDDAFALGALARLRVAQGRPAEALAVYTPLLQRDPRNLDLLLGAAQVAAQAGDKAQAGTLAETAVTLAPDNAAVLLDAARVQSASKHDRRAQELYAQALAAQPRDGATDDERDRQAAAGELAALRSEHSVEVDAGMFIRNRDGTGGISQISTLEAPVEARLPLGEGKLVLGATPVHLEAGAFSDQSWAANTFGAGGSTALAGTSHDSGVGYSLGYQLGGLQADIGLTPRGFLFEHVVGGLQFDDAFGHDDKSWYSLRAERRQVTDSVLSWAGTRDARDSGGAAWGGVLRTGALASVGHDFSDFDIYGYAGHDTFNGQGVLDNQRNRFGAGAQFALSRSDAHLLQLGVATSLMSYDNNQNHFTYGQGGYFSPQQYLWLGVPLTWAWRNPKLSYRIDAALGVQHIRQDAVAYFPANAQWQAAAGNPMYPQNDTTGLAYNLAATIEYKLSNRFSLGASANFDNAADYSQWNIGVYLHYRAQPKSESLSLPITPYRSPYAR